MKAYDASIAYSALLIPVFFKKKMCSGFSKAYSALLLPVLKYAMLYCFLFEVRYARISKAAYGMEKSVLIFAMQESVCYAEITASSALLIPVWNQVIKIRFDIRQ